MSPIALALDLLLAVLLGCALAVGIRLNNRLKLLKQGQEAFAGSIAELNAASARAEAGLTALRAAAEEVHDSLLARIETARGLIEKLDRAAAAAERSLASSTRAAEPSPSLAAIAAMAQPVAAEVFRRPLPSLAARPADAPPRRSRSAFDEELFTRPRPRDAEALGPLKARTAAAEPDRAAARSEAFELGPIARPEGARR